MQDNSELKPVDYLMQYFADLKSINSIKQKVKEMDINTMADVELKMDMELSAKQLSKKCYEFRDNIFADLTMREVKYLYLTYLHELPQKAVSKKIDRCYESLPAYKTSIIGKFTRALNKNLKKDGSAL